MPSNIWMTELWTTRVAGTAAITTTSGSDVVMTGLTVTPPAGTYLAIARSVVFATSNSRTISMSIFSGGVKVANSEVFFYCRTGGVLGGTPDSGMLSTEAIVTVDGDTAIDMRWRTSGGTAETDNYGLTLIRLSL